MKRHESYGALLAAVLSIAIFGFAYVSAPPASTPLTFLELTTAGARDDAPLPLVVAIHGRGSSPEQFSSAFSGLNVPVRLLLPRGPERYERGFQWYPLDRPLRRESCIEARADQLAALIAARSRAHPTLGAGAIVTGFSQGGVMSFALAAYHPAQIASALPIAAAMHRFMRDPLPAAHPPSLFAFHGARDPVMSLRGARRMVAAMDARGAHTHLETYDAGHELSDAMRDAMLTQLRALVRKQIAGTD